MGSDRAQVLCETVRRAWESGEGLHIVGSGSKSFLGPTTDTASAGARLLSVSEHAGILDYRPEELVLTARAGTPLAEIESALAGAGQHLPFEPPRFRGAGTLGGAVACGLSGPGRPWRGAVRDVVLGVEMINGRGERLRFGGQVMKNVAGYDVSRLQAGAFGTLGLLLAVSVKVLPQPEAEAALAFELGAAEALARCRGWARRALPLSGACFVDGALRLRLSGAAAAVTAAARSLGGEQEADTTFWQTLRDHRHPFFGREGLWRCSVPPAAPAPLEGCLVSWAGAERWWRPAAGESTGVNPAATLGAAGGHGRPFDRSYALRIGSHLPVAERRVAEALRHAMDPRRVFNPQLTCPGNGDAH